MWMITSSKWVKACMSEHKKSPWQTPQELFWVFLSNISSLEGDRGQLPTQFGVDLLQSSGGMSPCVSLWSPSNPVELSRLASWTTWVSFPQSLGSQSCAWDLLGGFINCTTFQANLQTLRFKRGGQPGAPPPGMRLSKPPWEKLRWVCLCSELAWEPAGLGKKAVLKRGSFPAIFSIFIVFTPYPPN